jgi:DNA-binding MarR family transcriptional regulator
MMDEVESTNETKVETPVSKKSPKPKKSPSPKKVAKPVKKAAKSKKPAKKEKVSRPARDNARKVAKATEGKLNTDQIRVLRSLQKGKTCNMSQIKEGCGMSPDQKYSSPFLKGIHKLAEERYIKVEKDQDNRAHGYTITEKGKSVLQKAETAAKAAMKA